METLNFVDILFKTMKSFFVRVVVRNSAELKLGTWKIFSEKNFEVQKFCRSKKSDRENFAAQKNLNAKIPGLKNRKTDE